MTNETTNQPPPAPAPDVYRAICAVQAEVAREGVAKSRRNQQQGYQFRGIDDMYNALSPLLAKHNLCIMPRVISRECQERTTQKGGVLFYVIVEAEFDFVCSTDGSTHLVRTFGEAMDSADKATNKAMSAAYKYAVMQTFAIPTEGDNDADATTYDVKPEPRAEPAQPQPANGAPKSAPKGGAEIVAACAKEIGKLCREMGFNVDAKDGTNDILDVIHFAFEKKLFRDLTHNEATQFLHEIQMKRNLFDRFKALVRALEFEPDAQVADEALVTRTQEALVTMASFGYDGRALRAHSDTWKTWLSEMQQKTRVPA